MKVGKEKVHNGSLTLDMVARATMRRQKLGKGEHAPILIREGKYHSLYEYCLQDVRLIRGLFEFALTNMYLMDGEASIIEMGKLDYSAVPAKLFADRMKQKKEMEDAKEAKDDREEDAPDILGEV